MTDALSRIREIVEQCGGPGCLRCWRELKAAVAVDEQTAERTETLAAEVHRLRQENAKLRKEVGRG